MSETGSTPQFAQESERLVWEQLARTVDPGTKLLANQRLTTQKKDYELDIVVLMPGIGIVVLEVKGGSVSVDERGQWWTGGGAHRNPIRPVDQARDGKYALRGYVERDPRWRNSSRTRVRWGHMVVVPFTDLDDDFATPDCPRWAISGRGDLGSLAERVRDVVARQEQGHRVPTEDDLDLVTEILTGRHLPAPDLGADADEREAHADRLTQEQAALLKVTRLIHRMEVRGGAGSGKTILALTQAKELTRGRADRRPQRVALLCYSIGLSEYFKRQVAGVPRKHRPAFVGCFEDLAREWGVTEFPERNDVEFWERGLSAQMAELAENLPEGKRFDAIIVDEAQDFADDWWVPLMRALKDEESGGLFVYSDENQRVFSRFGKPSVPLVPLVLDHNLRNTRQIATAFAPLTPMRMGLLGGDGPEVAFVPCATSDAVAVADEQVATLLEHGWRARDVALLTLGSRHPVHRERWNALGQNGYWRSFWEDDEVFFGHVLGCKGLERRAVVLCVNGRPDAGRATEMLYVGMSRATDELVVVGDPDVVRSIGGDDVAARLGISRPHP